MPINQKSHPIQLTTNLNYAQPKRTSAKKTKVEQNVHGCFNCKCPIHCFVLLYNCIIRINTCKL